MFTFISITDAFNVIIAVGATWHVRSRIRRNWNFYELTNFNDSAMEKQDGAAALSNIVSQNVLKKGRYSSKWYSCKIEVKEDTLTYQRIDSKVSPASLG